VPLGGARYSLTAIAVLDLDLVNSHRVFPFHAQSPVVTSQVDGVAATSRGLAANRTVTKIERVRVGTLKRKLNGFAVAGTLQAHFFLRRHDGSTS
jgi:hypothetical protein